MGRLYPTGTRPGHFLELYARAFDTVEVDSTFYGAPPAHRFRSWRDRTPDGFVFTLKMPGEVTHELRLEDPRPALRFCEDARALGPKLGPILVQLPPGFGPTGFDALAAFLHALPDDLRFAVEFRDRAWLTGRTRSLLEETGTRLAVSVGPWLDEAGAREAAGSSPGGIRYLRWLGTAHRGTDPAEVVAGRDREIEAWAELIREVEADEVYAFFNNDYQGHSPGSARRLQSLLGEEPTAPGELTPQRELFG